MEQSRRLRKNPHSYHHLIFNKGAKNVQVEKMQLLQQMVLGKQVIYM
jgi:hypothetical protein